MTDRPRKEGRRTRRKSGAGRGAPEPGGGEAREDVERGPRLVDVDPWAVLLEQLMEVPEEGGAISGPGQGRTNDQPGPRRPAKKGRGR